MRNELQDALEYHGPEKFAAIQEQLEQFNRETAYFLAHEEELLRQYPDQWVAIYGERVVGAHADYRQLLGDLRARGIPTNRTYMELLQTNPPLLIV